MDIITSIYQEPESWTQTEYTMRHTSGLQIWTRNGWAHYAPYPGGDGGWGWRMKRRFHKARRWWHENRPVSRLPSDFKRAFAGEGG